MSFAPDTLIELRRYLAEKTGKPRANFGIRGFVGKKRVYGYHLGEDDIYGPMGWGDRDYSVRRPRDRRGLTNASAGFDIKLPVPELKKLLKFLVNEARTGQADLMEIIGPNEDGNATDYRKPLWKPLVRKDPDKNDGHRSHIHISFPRDTEFADKIAIFEEFYGPRNEVDPTVPEEPDEPVEPEEPEPEPPTVDELIEELNFANDLLEEAEVVVDEMVSLAAGLGGLQQSLKER